VLYKKAVIAILSSRLAAEAALKALLHSGLDKKTLSIVGKDYLTVDPARGYYNAADCVNYWGKPGTFWGPLWGSTALVAALHRIGLPRDGMIKLEIAIKQGYFVLIVHGSVEEISKACEILRDRVQELEIFTSRERLQRAPSLSKMFF